MSGFALAGALCRLRTYRADDVDALHVLAADPLVSRWMTAAFPHPYTRTDATTFVALAALDPVPQHVAIEVDGAFAGGFGLFALHGESRGAAKCGYWLGQRFWGRGIATDAVRTMARYGFHTLRLRRLEATVFAPNSASAHVLDKAGFTLEARLREWYVERDGTVCDGLLFSRLASDPDPGAARTGAVPAFGG